MKTLFPTTQWIISNYYHDYSSYQEWFTQLRVCHKDHFDKYFKLSFDSEDFSTSDFINFLKLSSDREKLKEKILTLNARNLAEDFLSKFEAYSKQVPQENSKAYIYAMLDAGDQVNSESSNFLGFSAQTYLVRLCVWHLEDMKDISLRAQIIKDYIQQNYNFSMIEDIFLAEHQNRAKTRETLFDNSDFEQLKIDFTNILNQFANSNPEDLLKNSSFLSLMYRWKEWGILLIYSLGSNNKVKI